MAQTTDSKAEVERLLAQATTPTEKHFYATWLRAIAAQDTPTGARIADLRAHGDIPQPD